MIAQMGNVLKKLDLVSQRYVIEQNQMLMQLSHVTNMRHHRKTQFLCQKTHGEELAHSGKPCAIRLKVV